ncbi:Type III secretion needle MxiH like protein [Pseudovibrio sp. W64]|uniref:hypothetical protein n=1 Tax=unclassified Pseudovibrio TaxID=2627060 RepID=UPI0007AEC1DF|nr:MULTISPECIES: hypothetical protein [unclassified Pseudovibrio]KZK76703.1 Type III secretion needle MxiH like protein [Pseudovibrio sp. W64]KZK94227.1 Type III secretion needle MxiH like protein [Pseudovibrio sp. W74]KZL07754.1 Type III secretion needle MxiH like protein [Pseudovibrio sp. Ad14]
MATVLDSALTSQLQQALQGGAPSTGGSTGDVTGLEDQFQTALNAAGGVQPPVAGQIVNGNVVIGGVEQVNAAQNVAAVSAPTQIASVNPTDSNFVIDGLAKVRGVFAETSSNINAISEGGKLSHFDKLINMQIEVANYSLLVDVSSKIAGKTTQGLDALMR